MVTESISQSKAYYFREEEVDGQLVTTRHGPWPAFGQWPEIYRKRGFRLTEEREVDTKLYCPDEDCDYVATLHKEMADHAREEHDSDAYLSLQDGSVVFLADEEPSYTDELKLLTVPQLEARAREEGVYRSGLNKGQLIEALSNHHKAAEAQKVVDAADAQTAADATVVDTDGNGVAEADPQGPGQDFLPGSSQEG